MNWINELHDLYEKNENIAGEMSYKTVKHGKEDIQIPIVLLPVSHTTVAAQITLWVDEEGRFLRAEPVDRQDKLTIIPVTEKSGSRTAGVEPHPLCDNLKYLAGDYEKYAPPQKEGKKEKDYCNNHKLYLDGLKSWVSSPFTHKKAEAICAYLEKGSLVGDLVKAGVLQLDEKGKLKESVKLEGIVQGDVFVRFAVEGHLRDGEEILQDNTGRYRPECWLDKTLQQSFVNYYNSLSTEKGLSYLTGKRGRVGALHPKKIRNEGDGTKLISANDASGFTFRGRFADSGEAFAIGYEDSQKVHNALKWIIRRQGYIWGDMVVVVWESDLRPLPDFRGDTDAVIESYNLDPWEGEQVEPEYRGTNPAGALGFVKAMAGYGKRFDNLSRTALLAFDAATPGRLALTEHKIFQSSSYLENIQYWHASCEWIHQKVKEGNRFSYRGMVGIREMAEVLYGTERDGRLAIEGDSKLYADLCKRLLPCISQRKKLPEDLVALAVRKASSPVSYKEWYNWERALSMACSFVKKERRERRKEEWDLSLDKNCKDRSYLYGRLLAVADRMEYMTYSKEEGRETNAKRYMSAFSKRPYQTWKLLMEKLEPYTKRLKPGVQIYYNKLLEEIHGLFDVETYQNDQMLDGLYLLGFYHQADEMRNKAGEEELGGK